MHCRSRTIPCRPHQSKTPPHLNHTDCPQESTLVRKHEQYAPQIDRTGDQIDSESYFELHSTSSLADDPQKSSVKIDLRPEKV